MYRARSIKFWVNPYTVHSYPKIVLGTACNLEIGMQFRDPEIAQVPRLCGTCTGTIGSLVPILEQAFAATCTPTSQHRPSIEHKSISFLLPVPQEVTRCNECRLCTIPRIDKLNHTMFKNWQNWNCTCKATLKRILFLLFLPFNIGLSISLLCSTRFHFDSQTHKNQACNEACCAVYAEWVPQL